MVEYSEETYPSGLPFSEVLAVELESVRDQVFVQEMASVVILDGVPGIGKTTLAVHCADYIQRGCINIKTQVAQGGKQFSKVLEFCHAKKLPVCVYDEAGDFNRRGSLTKFNRMINNIFEKFRAFKVVVIICIPFVGSLDDELLHKGIVKLFIHCHKKNVKKKYLKSGVYGIKGLYLLKDRIRKIVVKPMAYSYISPNEWIYSKNLDPKRAEQLSELSTEGKRTNLFVTDLALQNVATRKDLRLETGASTDTVERYIKKFRLRPVKTIKNRSYYDRDDIDKLKQHMMRVGQLGKKKKVRI